ncbi:MAG: ABC transporter substrate-binding protein [Clostridia bacterium]|nr:ABC transporter substrate-binding protein [Clostridia bacterium]
MKKLCTILAILMALCMCASALAEVTITNTYNGEDFDITYDNPQRIVSTAGFTTEMLLALGLEDRIVGYSYMDNEIFPAYKEAFDKLNCLSDEWPSDEVLLSVEPDFVTGWASGFSDKHYNQAFCETNGILPYVPKVEGENASIGEAYEDLTNLGEIFGVQDRAAEVINDMQTRIAAVEAATKDAETVRVFIYDSGEDEPFTLGAGLASDMIAAAGGKNIFEDDFNYWGTVAWESVIDRDPEYIIVMDYFAGGNTQEKIDFLKNNEALADVTAVREGNIFVLGLTDVTGGVRNAEAIETMGHNFHADLF